MTMDTRRNQVSNDAESKHDPTPAPATTGPNQALLDQTKARKHPHTFRIWWQEMLSMLLAFAALLALFATLYAYVDKPSPDWPDWISINTIVSIYIVLLKACVLVITASGLSQLKWEWFAGRQARPLSDLVEYDSASRGPLGAFSLIWRVKFSHALSSTGALIVILALATDPFTQQIIRYRECQVHKKGASASIPRTNYYIQTGEHTGSTQEAISSGAQNAIVGGVYNPIPDPTAHCGTGNCTFPQEYSSVGWCSVCEDITYQLAFNNVSWSIRDPSGNASTTLWNTTTSLPGGLSVTMSTGSYLVPLEEFAAMSLDPDTGALDFILGKHPDDNMPWINSQTGTLWPDCHSTANNKTLWKCKGYGASSCSLFPCVKTHSASIELGVVTETVVGLSKRWGQHVEQSTSIDPPVPPMATLDTKCITPYERQSLQQLGYEFNSEERWLAYNLTITPATTWHLNDTFPDSMVKRNCVYAIDTIFEESVQAWLGQLFNGSIIAVQANPGPTSNFYGPQIIQSIYNFGDITFDRMQDTFDNISIALTNYVRQNGASNFSASAAGIAYEEKTCITVRWAWLTYPSALALLTLVFLVFVLIETRPIRNRPEVWKSSPLALLYYGLFDEDGDVPVRKSRRIEDREGMRAFANVATARLTAVGQLEIRDKHHGMK